MNINILVTIPHLNMDIKAKFLNISQRELSKFYYSYLAPLIFRPLIMEKETYLNWDEISTTKYSDETSTLIESENKKSLPTSLTKFCGKYNNDAQFLLEFQDGVVHKSGIISLSNGQVLRNSFPAYQSFFPLYKKEILERKIGYHSQWWKKQRFNPFQPKKPLNLDKVFPLVRLWNGQGTRMSYYHWVLEDLPRLRALKMYKECHRECPHILIESNPPAWLLEQLDILGINKRKLVTLPERGVKAEKLIYATQRHHSGYNFNPCTSDLKWLRECFSNELQPNSEEPPSKIFISRQDADNRQIANYDEVNQLLSNLGFEVLKLADISEHKILQTFSSADYIIGPHGAGLTNILFSTNTKVLEIFPPLYIDPSYFCISKQLGHSYDYLIGESVNENIKVNIQHLKKYIKQDMLK